MAEYAQVVCHGRLHFHIALVQDISSNCDCHGENDAAILPDIRMFASFDPVALDQAEKVGLGTREYELKRIK